MLLDGAPGVPKDRAAAKAQFEKAAAQGHPGALYNLGVLAIEGRRIRQSPTSPRRRDYFRRAARRRRRQRRLFLWRAAARGTGVPLDIAESARWLKRAADGGIIAGQVEYAIMLFNGVGVTRDEAGAAKLFTRPPPITTRSRRIASPISTLTGRGVPKDLVRAALWHSFAKAAGIADAELDKATAHLSDAELTELRGLVHQQQEF